MMLRMNLPDVSTYELAQKLARELGLTVNLEHGPKEDCLEGLRIITVSGNPFEVDLPRRLNDMQNAFAAFTTRMLESRMTAAMHLDRLMGVSPDWVT